MLPAARCATPDSHHHTAYGVVASPKRRDGQPLISGVNQACEVEPRRQLYRQEAMRLDAESREEVAVSHAGDQERHGQSGGISVLHDCVQRVGQAQIGRGWAGGVAHDLERDETTGQVA
jgi:hypothetical protein